MIIVCLLLWWTCIILTARYWCAYPGNLIYRQYLDDEHLPLYNNGTIYVPLENGIIAYDRQGREKWTKTYNADDFSFQYVDSTNQSAYMPGAFRLYSLMPFDTKGDVYLEYASQYLMNYTSSYLLSPYPELYLMTIRPTGTELSREEFYANKYLSANNGIGFATSDSTRVMLFTSESSYPDISKNLTSLETKSLIAFDLSDGRQIWNYTFLVDEPSVVTIDESNRLDNIPYDRLGTYLILVRIR